MLGSEQEIIEFYKELREAFEKKYAFHIEQSHLLDDKIEYAITNNICDPISGENVLTTAAIFGNSWFLRKYVKESNINNSNIEGDNLLLKSIMIYLNYEKQENSDYAFKQREFIAHIRCYYPTINLEARGKFKKTALELVKQIKKGQLSKRKWVTELFFNKKNDITQMVSLSEQMRVKEQQNEISTRSHESFKRALYLTTGMEEAVASFNREFARSKRVKVFTLPPIRSLLGGSRGSLQGR